MLLAKKLVQRKCALKKIKKEDKCSLQVQIHSRRRIELKKWLRASCPASCMASFTVEAAFILPIIVFVLCGFLYFLVILNMQIALYEELSESARKTARYAFTYEEILHMAPSEEEQIKREMEPGLTDMLYHGFSSAYALGQIKKGIGKDWLDQSCIRNGADGLSLLSDSLISNNQMVDMVLRYYVDIPILPGKWFGLFCVQRVHIRTFTGFMPQQDKESLEDAEKLVYITETGTVYHTNRYCTHLNLSVKRTDSANLETIRNSNGGKYYACELCGGIPDDSGTVVLTVHGDRYHSSTECQGLKRSWKAVPLSEVGDRKLCTRCQKQE